MCRKSHKLLRSEHLSYSRLESYRKCPHQFKLQYLDGHISVPSAAMMKGTVVHAVIAERLMQIKKAKRVESITSGQLKGLVKPIRTQLAAEGQETRGFLNSELDRLLDDFARRMPLVDGRMIHEIESEKITKLGPYKYKSVLDLILKKDDGSIYIIDYKSGKSKYIKDDFQLRSYALPILGAKSGTATTVTLSYWFLMEGITRTIQMSQGECQAVVNRIAAEAAEIESDEDYEPRPSFLCDYCGVRQHCPAYGL